MCVDITTGDRFAFSLPDASAGGERRSASDIAGNRRFLFALLLRDHYCPECRELVQRVADATGAFAARSTAVVGVLPDRIERAALWQRRYDLSFSMLADEGSGEGSFDAFAPFQDSFDPVPGAVLFAVDGDRLRVHRTFVGDSSEPFPSVEAVLTAIDEAGSEAGGPDRSR